MQQRLNVPTASELRLGRRALLGLAVVTGLAGCATGAGGGEGGGKEALLARAQAYWAAVQRNDLVAAWAFEQASLDPKNTLQAYLRRGGVVYNEAKVLEVVEQGPDEAMVNVAVVFDVPIVRLRDKEEVMHEKWVLVQGMWYRALPRKR